MVEQIEKTEQEQKKSTHRVDVIEVKLNPHPNADSLSLVNVYGYQVCVRTVDWKDGQLGAYIIPDSLVPLDKEIFSFLRDVNKPDQTHSRIKVKRLRGIYSQGLLVPAPEGSNVGDDVSEQLGVTRYEPPIENDHTNNIKRGSVVPGPSNLIVPKYDVDSCNRYGQIIFQEGEIVRIHEKIHGANWRATFHESQLFVGSRNEWKKYNKDVIWWKALLKYPQLIHWMLLNPSYTVYGEVFGCVQDLKYDHKDGEVSLALFDILNPNGQFLNSIETEKIQKEYVLPWVPYLGEFPFSNKIYKLAEGQSTIASHVREGVVIRSIEEKYTDRIGRHVLKIVGNGYLEKA